jgi:hypothetical protein
LLLRERDERNDKVDDDRNNNYNKSNDSINMKHTITTCLIGEVGLLSGLLMQDKQHKPKKIGQLFQCNFLKTK